MPRLFGMVTTSLSHSYTPYALRSFYDYTPLNSDDRVILIDNNRDFDSASLPRFPQFEIERPAVPRSFAANGNSLRETALKLNADLYFMNNDLIFTPLWNEGFDTATTTLLSPCSNREYVYDTASYSLCVSTSLELYLGHEHDLLKIASKHRSTHPGTLPVLVLPFFCIRVPNRALTEVGNFDESYGAGGGEDFDYCLRAHLKGFTIAYSLPSFILHFGGRSTWSGGETKTAQQARETDFFRAFKHKWGDSLTDIVLHDNLKPLESNPELQKLIEQREFVKLIEKLK